MSEWYETFFDALAFDVWDRLMPADVSNAEATFLLHHLCGTDPTPRRLLDVPCGDGRLALRVAAAEAGHDVVGVDLSPVAIERLLLEATAAGLPRISAWIGDMRHLRDVHHSSPSFDGAWCMGNSFGYLSPPDTARFLDALSTALRPGARFVLDAAIVAECVLPHLGAHDRYESDGATLVNVNTYDAVTSTMVTDMTLTLGGRQARREVRHRVMTCGEIVEDLRRAGISVVDVFGSLDGETFKLGSPRCLIVAQRR
jgi:SAM-dependent methyltransferase